MKTLPRLLSALSLLSSITLLERPGHPLGVVLWIPKLLVSATTPLLVLLGSLAALLGLRRGDKLATAAGITGAALALRYIHRINAATPDFAPLAEPDRPIPPLRGWPPRLSRPAGVRWQRDLLYGFNPTSQTRLLADLWLPPEQIEASGLAVIYAHGGAWRLGDKDMGTRPFFRRLAGQGHAVMDIAYSLAPQATIPDMVADLQRAIRWLRENGPAHGANPAQIVLMGGSAGGHLALLTAYAGSRPALKLDDSADLTVDGVVAFYPPVDLASLHQEGEVSFEHLKTSRSAHLYKGLAGFIWRAIDLAPRGVSLEQAGNYLERLLGVTPAEDPDLYDLLSPISYVDNTCPPTLLLQGSSDLFGLAPDTKRLYTALRQTGVPAILAEFPASDHAFDLILPRLSPPAQAAIQAVEQFLALLTVM